MVFPKWKCSSYQKEKRICMEAESMMDGPSENGHG
jgi:hypothetical protein